MHISQLAFVLTNAGSSFTQDFLFNAD